MRIRDIYFKQMLKKINIYIYIYIYSTNNHLIINMKNILRLECFNVFLYFWIFDLIENIFPEMYFLYTYC